jgi:replicative DNA helicase
MVTEIRPGIDLAPTSNADTPRSLRDVLRAARLDPPEVGRRWRSPLATGFDLLDRLLDGGLRNHELLVLGGSPGVGKTVAALQMARHAARQGRPTVYVSFEHDEATMLGRLLVMELGDMATPELAPEVDRLRDVVVAATNGYRSLDAVIATEPIVAEAVERLDRYADQLSLVRGAGSRTDLAALESLAPRVRGGETGLLVVDYLQKVAVPDSTDEAVTVRIVAEGLKDLALRHDLAVIAVVAADQEGVTAGRTRLHHLRGSTALAYEADVAVLLNDKHRAVSREHLTYDPVRAEGFHHQVVLSLEKNRSGPAMVDLEFGKDLARYRFETRGRYLTERLVDDRVVSD